MSLAAILRGAGEPLSLERFAIPDLTRGEALVRIRCCTICGSDLHSYHGRRPSPLPSVLGHEMVGTIEATGPGGLLDHHGQILTAGDRVVWSMVWSCGECFYCARGLRPKCERLMKFGHEKITPGRALVGGMAEHCVLPERTAIFRVPPNVPDTVASPASCATATVAAVFRQAGPVDGRMVVVHGAGMLGQTACTMAASMGAREVIVIEPDAGRRESASRFGATIMLDSATPRGDIQQHVLAASGGRGSDIGLELAGYAESVELGLTLLRAGGRFVMAGATFPDRPVQWEAESVVRRMLQIVGVYNYAPEDLAAALSFLSANVDRYPFAALVERTFPLDQVNAAMQFAEVSRAPRVALLP